MQVGGLGTLVGGGENEGGGDSQRRVGGRGQGGRSQAERDRLADRRLGERGGHDLLALELEILLGHNGRRERLR